MLNLSHNPIIKAKSMMSNNKLQLEIRFTDSIVTGTNMFHRFNKIGTLLIMQSQIKLQITEFHQSITMKQYCGSDINLN